MSSNTSRKPTAPRSLERLLMARVALPAESVRQLMLGVTRAAKKVLDSQGRAHGSIEPRNVFIDTLDSAYGPGWKREAGILVHSPTGTFCHSFVPQKPFPGYPSDAMRPAAPGERYRISVMGPGVTPVVSVEVPGLTGADRQSSGSMDAVWDRVMTGDARCAPER